MRVKWLHFGLWLWAVGLARLGAAPLHESAPLFTRIGEPAIIPAEVSSNGMCVSVMIDGKGPFRMLIDTGCSFSMITPEVEAAIEASGIEMEDEDVRAVNGLGDAVTMPRVLLDSVAIGGVEFDGVIAGVVPLELQSRVEGRSLDGLLGYSLFSSLFFALDFPNHNLVLSSDWPKNLPPVRAELAITEQSEVPFVAVKLQDQEFSVMIDTGASDRFHLPPASAASLSWKSEPRPGFLLAVAGETGREQIARLAGTLELGPVREMEPVVGLSAGPATIGVGLLRSFCLVFHEAEDKLWLCSAQDNPVPSPAVLSVGLSLLADPGGWRVAGIIPNSPAEEAGIGEGDLVTQIEGRPAQDWTQDQIQGWLDAHASIALKLATRSGERDLNLRVWSLVP